MGYKFEKTNCYNCGTNLETAEPTGDVREEPNTKELRGTCPKCRVPQLVVEGEPDPEVPLEE